MTTRRSTTTPTPSVALTSKRRNGAAARARRPRRPNGAHYARHRKPTAHPSPPPLAPSRELAHLHDGGGGAHAVVSTVVVGVVRPAAVTARKKEMTKTTRMGHKEKK